MTDKNTQTSTEIRRLIPVTRFNHYHPDPSVSSIRWMIFTNKDGFQRCVVRRCNRVLIDEAEYFKWLAEQNDKRKWS